MKNLNTLITLFSLCIYNTMIAQETTENIQFNDRNSDTHGVFIGLSSAYGTINKENTYVVGAKIAYIANEKVELGFAGNIFYTEQEFNPDFNPDGDIIGAYGGLYISPIIYKKSKFKISLPILLGAGSVGYTNKKFRDDDFADDGRIEDNDYVALVEPGVAIGYNISTYIQLEVLTLYRLSSKAELEGSTLDDINGFSVGIGLKFGIFSF